MQANLFASSAPAGQSVQLGVDTRGRLWAATWGTYPGKADGTMNTGSDPADRP
jgi:hypothetical protein